MLQLAVHIAGTPWVPFLADFAHQVLLAVHTAADTLAVLAKSFVMPTPYAMICINLLPLCRAAPSAASDENPRQAELPYPMSAWTWDRQDAATDWMVVPTGDAGLGLQVCPPHSRFSSCTASLSLC